MKKSRFSLIALACYFITCPPAFFMAGLAYGGSAARLIEEEPDYALFVQIGGFAIPVFLLAAIIFSVLAYKRNEPWRPLSIVGGAFSLGFNAMMFPFWSRLFFDILHAT
ncbi:hypothetical protein [Dysgonomonas sp. 25]|uniref:hypothetical protein n=1 Tax=Dysgonomonas sp. 25 TaxID=2302933 RepID=UPI0013D3090A|nr:hypothetical protein [Dysgonomonas sp. 25]NDV69208.1 hypothetical protein [Dysgonomonas sp. 25]